MDQRLNPASLGERCRISTFVPDRNGDFIEINHGNHGSAAIVVWKMEGDERTPKCEDFARRLVASYNACLHISLDSLESERVQHIYQQVLDLQATVRPLEDRECMWETMMMQAVGEDGPASVVEAINALKECRDAAWREQAAIRKAINANPEESTLDEVRRVVEERDILLIGKQHLLAECREKQRSIDTDQEQRDELLDLLEACVDVFGRIRDKHGIDTSAEIAARAAIDKYRPKPDLSKCTKTLQEAGQAYPKTCQVCGLGPCKRG